MKSFKNILILFNILIVCFLLSACGGNLRTKLNIDSDFKGSRVMEFTVNKSENMEYIKADIETITENLKTQVPGELKFESADDGANIIYTFTLDFDSKKDYEDKLRKLLGDKFQEYAELCEYKNAENVFQTGIKIYEHFKSQDLLQWFVDFLINNEYVSQEHQSNIFDQVKYTIVYNSEELSQGIDPIYYDDLKTLKIANISFYTNIKAPNLFDRTIIFKFEKDLIKDKVQEIESFLKDKAKEAQFNKEEINNYIFFVLKLEDVDDIALNKFTQNITGFVEEDNFILIKDDTLEKENSNISQTEETKEETTEATKEEAKDSEDENKEPKGDPWLFYSINNIKEKIYLKYYPETEFNYYISADSTYKNINNEERILYAIDDTQRSVSLGTPEEILEAKKWVGETPYSLIIESYYYDNIPTYQLEYISCKSYDIKDLQIKTKLKENGTYIRNVDIEYKSKLSKEYFEEFKAKTEEKFSNFPIQLKSLEKTDEGFKLSLQEDSSKNKLQNPWAVVFGNIYHREIPLYYIENNKSFKKKVLFREQFYLSYFTRGNIEKFSYEISNIGKALFRDETNIKNGKYKLEYENLNLSDNSAANIINGILKLEVNTIRTSPKLYISYLLIILIIAIVILLVLRCIKSLNLNKSFEDIKNKIDKETPLQTKTEEEIKITDTNKLQEENTDSNQKTINKIQKQLLKNSLKIKRRYFVLLVELKMKRGKSFVALVALNLNNL